MASSTALFISQNRLKEASPLNNNIDASLLYPHIYTAQNLHIHVVLGTELYDDIIKWVLDNTSTTENYTTLVNDYIQDALIHWTIVEALPFLAFKIAEGEITQKNSENGTSATTDDVEYLVQKERDKAEFFTNRLVDYLINNSSLYPKYSQSSGGDIDPIQTTQYFSGVEISQLPTNPKFPKSILNRKSGCQ